MRILILIVILSVINGCSAPNRLNRLHKNHPYLFEKKIDTLPFEYKDTIYVDKVKIDTMVHKDIDTIYMEKERLKIRVIKEVDSIYVSGECDTDTIYVDKIIEVPYNKYEVEVKEDKSVMKWWIFLFIIISISMVLILRKK